MVKIPTGQKLLLTAAFAIQAGAYVEWLSFGTFMRHTLPSAFDNHPTAPPFGRLFGPLFLPAHPCLLPQIQRRCWPKNLFDHSRHATTQRNLFPFFRLPIHHHKHCPTTCQYSPHTKESRALSYPFPPPPIATEFNFPPVNTCQVHVAIRHRHRSLNLTGPPQLDPPPTD